MLEEIQNRQDYAKYTNNNIKFLATIVKITNKMKEIWTTKSIITKGLYDLREFLKDI